MGDDQTDTLTFLERLSASNNADGRPARIETHAAYVFLAGQHAYKLKRAVDRGYLDFSTLAQRKYACDRELELNGPLAPDIYLAVLPLIQSGDGGICLGDEASAAPDGDTVDWVIKMRRFDDAQLFSTLGQHGGLSSDLLRATTDRIVAAHRQARIKREPVAVARLAQVISDIAKRLATLDPERGTAFLERAQGAYARWLPVMHQRAREGFVRRCHGDLHLRNLVVFEGQPCLFDALEFDEDLATIDVLYDFAFLLMDLLSLDLKTEANQVLNAYLTASGETANLRDLGVLDFFMALRAGVRAMVAVDLAVGQDAEAATPHRDEAGHYVDLALALLQERTPSLYAVGGLSGTGKSTVSASIAPDLATPLGAIHLRSDVVRKHLFGVAPTTALPADAYTPEQSERVYRALLARAELLLRSGRTVIVDAVFGRENERSAFAAMARRLGVSAGGVWLTADTDVLEMRVTQRVGDASDADAQVVRMQAEALSMPDDWTIVRAEGAPETVAQRSLTALTAD